MLGMSIWLIGINWDVGMLVLEVLLGLMVTYQTSSPSLSGSI